MNDMISLFIILLSSYLAGSIPTSIIVSRITRGIDIRNHGSGNAGASNAIRVLGWKLGLIVILVDVGKGILATAVISGIRIDTLTLTPATLQILAGSLAIIGHIWTIFAGFRGGKGVATGGGMIFYLYPIAASLCLIIFIVILLAFRIVSLASIGAATALPIIIIVLKTIFGYSYPRELLIFAILASILILFTHRSNIRRLIRGEENRWERRNVKGNK
jgi:glycerol-3-phosphate acyltransferase PlsY